MVVLPLPADPCTAINPEVGRVTSSNWPGIDQRGDGGQVAIHPARATLVEAQAASCGDGDREGRCSGCGESGHLPTGRSQSRGSVARDGQLRVRGPHLTPGSVAEIARERSLWRGDPTQFGIDDRDRPARQDVSLDDPIAHSLFVGIALLIAIEKPRHRRVPPVDDLHAATRLDETARADQHVAPAPRLLQTQMPEVRRFAIDGR